MSVARVHVEAWRSAYRGIIPQEFLDSLDVRQRARNYTFDAESATHLTWIALEGGTVVGFVTVGQSRETDTLSLGEVQALYVATDRWRSGVGSTLLEKAEGLLRAAGNDAAYLWVLEENARGRRFYESQGWGDDGHQQIIELGGRPLVELRYRKKLSP